LSGGLRFANPPYAATLRPGSAGGRGRRHRPSHSHVPGSSAANGAGPENRATAAQVSMAKRNSCDIAQQICRDARQMLGGMGITGEYSVMRHMMNLESVITYEGTHDIHLLITGLDVTGLNAFG